MRPLLLVLLLASGLTAQMPSKPPKQYKRIHQQVLKALVHGKLSKARQSLAEHVERNPKDPEHWFLTTLVEAKAGDTERARAAIRKALELGLPPERFLAGPRSLLAGVAQSPELVKVRAAFAHKPIHGPLLGDLTGTSVKVWVRTATPSDVEVLVRTDRTGEPIVAQGRTRARDDFTGVVQVNGLQPQRHYYYKLRVDGGEPVAGGAFRTFPKRGAKAKLRIAFGGGSGFVPQHERMWNTIGSFAPDALFLFGDNVYIDAPKMREMQDFCYYRRQSRPEFRRLTATIPVYAIWDDHDFGVNDCWYGPDPDKPAWKSEVFQVFKQNWANPGYGTENSRGCHFEVQIADLWFGLLDGRSYRSDPKLEAPSMLGPAQNQWIRERLVASKGTFRMLCSPVPWVFAAKGNSRDTWNGFQQERHALFDFVRDHKIEGIVLLSADRHRTDIWNLQHAGLYQLTEFNSSRLTNQHVHKTMRKALFSYNKKQSFGLVEFDTTLADPTVTMKVVTIDGEVKFTHQIKRSTLCAR